MSALFFGWVDQLVEKGAVQGRLQYEDLLPTAPQNTPRECTHDLWHEWTKLCTKGKPSLLRAIIGAYGRPYFKLGILKFFNDGLTFAGAMLLNLLVKHLEQSTAATTASSSSSSSADGFMPGWIPRPGDSGWGFVLAVLLGLSALAKAVIGSHYNYRLSVVTVRLRGGVMGVLFRTALLTRSADAAGDVSTLMAVDTGRLSNICVSFHELWSLPLQIAAAMWLLYTQVRTAFIAGVVLCVALVPINRAIAQKIQAASIDLMSAKDYRLSLMGEVLRHMGVVKALGWEQIMGDKIRAHRGDELKALAVRKYLDALCVYFWAATQLLLSGTTFGLMVLLGQPLQPSVVFTCLALFNVLIAPINAFPWVVNGVVEAVVSLHRLQAYCLLPQRAIGWAYPEDLLPKMLQLQQQQQQQQTQNSIKGTDKMHLDATNHKQQWGQQQQQWGQQQQLWGQQQQQWGQQHPGSILAQNASCAHPVAAKYVSRLLQLQPGVAAQLHNATFTWQKGQPPCLSDLQLSIPAGCLTAVVGEVGSSKSSLLAALVGELDITQGFALLPNRQIMGSGFSGYLPQGLDLDQSGFDLDLRSGLGFSSDAAAGKTLISSHNTQNPGSGSSGSSSGGSGAKPWQAARVSYVSQSPWLMPGSVRDNILMGQPYDAEFMGEILHAVGLDQDLAALPAGDLTQVGDGGTGLSGGQRVRVALARALYQKDTDTFIFDDILANLDSHVAQWVIRHTLFGGLLQGATVVLVTKHPLVIQSAQLVIGLELGRVGYCGSAQGFAHWKATQAVHMSATGDAAAANGWVPLIRPSSPRPRVPQLASGHVPTSHSPPHSPLRTSHQSSRPSSYPGDTKNFGVNFGGNLGENFPSEDVAPSELLIAGGHGVWACHASLSPQLNVISENLDSDDGSGALGSSLGSREHSMSHGGSQEPRSPIAAAAAAAQQQQRQQSRDESNPVGLAAAAAAAAAADLVDHQHGDLDAAAGSSSDEQQQQQQDEEESRAVGAVRWSVYVSYMKAVGGAMCVAVLVSLVLMQATKNGIDLWVTRSLTNTNNNNDTVITIPVTLPVTVSGTIIGSSSGGGGLDQLSVHSAAAAAGLAAVSAAAYNPQLPEQQQQQQQHEGQYPNIQWQPAHLDSNMLLFLKGLGIIAGLNTLATLARAFSFAAAGMAAARSTHELLLAAVLGAKMTFFDANPAGRILNRFSSDTSMIDDSLPFILNILLANAVSLAGLLAVLLLGQPLLILLLLPLAVAYRRLQCYYRSSARELRRLEAAGLSPLYSTFGEAVQGAATIRAAAAQQHFMKQFLLSMDPYQAASLNNAAAANWLGARLQLLAAVLLTAVAAVAAAVAAAAAAGPHSSNALEDLNLHTHHTTSINQLSGIDSNLHWLWQQSLAHGSSSGGSSSGSGSSSAFRINLLGLALAYCLPIVQLLNGLLTSSAETEQEMVSVERVMAYLNDITPEEQQQQQQRQQRQQLLPGSRSQSPQQQQQQERLSPMKLKRMQRQEWRRQRLYGQQQQNELQQLLLPDQQQPQAIQPVAAAETAAAVEFIDVVMRYRPGLPPALSSVSFKVAPGQKLGICGRTGAGKSSIIAALLRLRPIDAGIILVQGSNAADMPLQDLRDRFGIVPQNPVLFSGTIRDNLDPTGAASDEQLAAALQAVHMWATLCSIALHRGALGHGTYLLARRAVGFSKRRPNPAAAAAAGSSTGAGPFSAAARTSFEAVAAAVGDHSIDQNLTNSMISDIMAASPVAAAAAAESRLDSVDSLATFLHQDGGKAPAAASSSNGAAAAAAESGNFQVPEITLTPAVLSEGAAAAIGAAAGRAAAAAASPRSVISYPATPTSAAAAAGSRRSTFSSFAAAVGSVLLSPRRGSSRSTWDFPPVPMYPASKVLSMKVGGPSGIQLSAGQQQLVCVARVLIRRSPLVLLDESTAAIDPTTASLIHQVLHEQLDVAPSHSLSGERPTVLQVAHELSAIMDYDQVAVMSAGRVVETGKPTELAAREGSRFGAMLAQLGHQHAHVGQQQQQQQRQQ